MSLPLYPPFGCGRVGKPVSDKSESRDGKIVDLRAVPHPMLVIIPVM